MLHMLQMMVSHSDEASAAFLGKAVGTLFGLGLGFFLVRRLLAGSKPSASPAAQPLRTASDEKRQLAKRLVSEIRLRNVEQVDTGRRSRDLAVRFDQDLRLSYKTFVERVGEGPASARIFQDEVVKILAGGDAGALGTLPWLGLASPAARK
jgi:hypothetical protein